MSSLIKRKYTKHDIFFVLYCFKYFRGVSLGTSSAAQWIEMGAAIVAGIESGWVNPVINQVTGFIPCNDR